jgi:predicted RND superfamily exporter protein
MPIKQSFNTVDEHLGGSASVQLLVDGQDGRGMRDLELLRGLAKLEKHIYAFSDPWKSGLTIGHSMSILDVVRETNQTFHGGAAKHYRLPEDERGISDMLFMFESAGPAELRQLATNDLGRSQMTFRTRFIDATSYQPLVEHLEAGIKVHIPPGRQVRPTGTVYTLLSTIGSLIWDLLKSFGLAFVVITLIMMILLGGFKLGAIAMVPNLLPIVSILAFMGVAGIPIDMSTILIASISIGVAVDDTIHLLHHYRVNLVSTGNVETSIRRAMNHSGRAMVTTSVILVMGFAAYLGASVANVQRFGLLVSLTAILALLIDLIFAPALLRTFYGRLPASEEESSHASS